MENKQKLSIYIHIPFCVRKCFYCDFLSAPAGEETKKKYVDMLLLEIEKEAKLCQNYEVVSIFFGGGTPSVLEAEDTVRIAEQLKRCFSILEEAEISIEVNPGTVNGEKLRVYKECGFNRLSIGLQSADDKELKTLGRMHDYQEFLETFHEARKVGFENINVDLIAAIPGQTLTSYESTLKKLLKLSPEHISAYSLIVEEKTPFFDWYGEDAKQGDRLPLPDEDTERKMYERTEQLLLEQGYYRYEISNYAKPGFACEHNKAYWTRQDYFGFGIGAASLMGRERFRNKTGLSDYIAGDFEKEERQQLSTAECMEEFMFLGLRLVEGVEKQEFKRQFAVPMEEVYGSVLAKMKAQNLLCEEKGRVFLSKKGMDVSNYVMAEFLL